MKKRYLPIISFLLLQSVLFCVAQAATNYSYSTKGANVRPAQKVGMQIGQYNTKSNISVIEYDTYGAVSGYYFEDSFGMKTKYDKNGNALGYFTPDSSGLVKKYDMDGNHLNTYKKP